MEKYSYKKVTSYSFKRFTDMQYQLKNLKIKYPELIEETDRGLRIKQEPHAQAIENISRLLKEELPHCSVEIQKTCWIWAVPDILVTLGTDKYLVVEVERTYATKFKKYLDEKTIKQIRWYDLECNLVGEWLK